MHVRVKIENALGMFERDVKEMYRKHSYNLLHSVMNILQENYQTV